MSAWVQSLYSSGWIHRVTPTLEHNSDQIEADWHESRSDSRIYGDCTDERSNFSVARDSAATTGSSAAVVLRSVRWRGCVGVSRLGKGARASD